MCFFVWDLLNDSVTSQPPSQVQNCISMYICIFLRSPQISLDLQSLLHTKVLRTTEIHIKGFRDKNINAYLLCTYILFHHVPYQQMIWVLRTVYHLSPRFLKQTPNLTPALFLPPLIISPQSCQSNHFQI